jgi:hypothetical protein
VTTGHDVVLIVVVGLQADHVQGLGALAALGTRFTRCFAPSGADPQWGRLSQATQPCGALVRSAAIHDRSLTTVLETIDLAETIVVVTSDDRADRDADPLPRGLRHVPLLVSLPEPLRARYAPPPVEERVASTLDVLPTLATLVGGSPAGFPGEFLFDLPTHRLLQAEDREGRYELCYPLKSIRLAGEGTRTELAYNLAYDPDERVDLLAERAPAVSDGEPITFVIVVNDRDELATNLLASPVTRSSRHEWLLIDNEHNRRSTSVSRLYADALAAARNDLVFFMHQDLYLPAGWEARMYEALGELEELDPRWGVLGAVGARAGPRGDKEWCGHWCDPHAYSRRGPLPAAVDALDEQWLGLRRSRGAAFDPDLPGFHGYGMDLCLTARAAGMKSYAVDAFVWHKWRLPNGALITRRDDSPKIVARRTASFEADFDAAVAYVDRKWARYKPFHGTSWSWT